MTTLRRITFLSPFLILLLLGCTGQPAGEGASTQTALVNDLGLNILSFTTSRSALRTMELTDVDVVVRNDGNYMARNLTSIIYGYGSLDEVTGARKNRLQDLTPTSQNNFHYSFTVPVSITELETTSYTLNTRVYYVYNFNASTQLAFVPTEYTGSTPVIASTTSNSTLQATITSSRAPVRLINNWGNFSLEINVQNTGHGNVKYLYEESGNYNLNGNKSNFINALSVIVPSDWDVELEMGWIINDLGNGRTEYKLDYDYLEDLYYAPVYTCQSNVLLSTCSCTQSSSDECNQISEARRKLWMIRGDTATIVLQFSKAFTGLQTPLIEPVSVSGEYGYEIDTSTFTGPININVIGE